MSSSPKIKLVIGLGNPGPQYANTYHNAGFLFVDYLKNNHLNSKFKILNSDACMNESGSYVKKAIKKYGAKPEVVLIAHDDSDIALGNFKLSFGRGSAGHKGIESIIQALGTNNFWRLRIGVRNPNNRAKAESFVLKKISAGDGENLKRAFLAAAELLPTGQV